MKYVTIYMLSIIILLSSSCGNRKHISKKSPAANKKYSPCNCKVWD